MKEVILEGIATKGMLRDGVPADDVFRALLRSLLDEGKARGELDEDTDTYAAAKLIESVQTITMVECLQGEASRETFRDEITKQLDIVFRGLAAAARPGGRGEA